MTLIPLFFFLVTSFLSPVSASAQCPICVVTVGGGMLIAKKLGVDDFLVSIWISALNTALSFWIAGGMRDKSLRPKFLHNPWIFSVLMLILTLAYFQFTDQIGHISNKLLGMDKIVFGQVLGMLVMFVGNFIYGYTKYKNGNKALFPYSKVVFPVGLVLLVTLIFKLSFNL